MMLYIQDFGYYGPKTQAEDEWTVQQVRGELTTFERYLILNPIHVE